MSKNQLVYFADPMCSWCYGFAPVIAALAERLTYGYRPLDDVADPPERWLAAGAPITAATH